MDTDEKDTVCQACEAIYCYGCPFNGVEADEELIRVADAYDPVDRRIYG